MNQPAILGGSTRRSFIKRSVVAAVGLSSMTIFAGLVKADEPGSVGSQTVTANCGGNNANKSKCCQINGKNAYTCTGGAIGNRVCDNNQAAVKKDGKWAIDCDANGKLTYEK